MRACTCHPDDRPPYCQHMHAASECRAQWDAFVEQEKVDHPSHYGGDTPYEVIKVLEAWLTPEMFKGFLLGNVIKYQARAHLKGTESEDHRKALWYQDYLVKWEMGLAAVKMGQAMSEMLKEPNRCVPRYDEHPIQSGRTDRT